MRLSDHDQEMVEEVSVAASTESERPALCCVHFDGGRVFASDAYRLDVRDADEDRTFTLNPYNLAPFTNDLPLPLDRCLNMLGTKPLTCADGLTAADLPTRLPASLNHAFCMCCGRHYEYRYRPTMPECRCHAPMVNPKYLRAAMDAADEPIRWVWSGGSLLTPIGYREDDHVHLLMTIRRSTVAS